MRLERPHQIGHVLAGFLLKAFDWCVETYALGGPSEHGCGGEIALEGLSAGAALKGDGLSRSVRQWNLGASIYRDLDAHAPLWGHSAFDVAAGMFRQRRPSPCEFSIIEVQRDARRNYVQSAVIVEFERPNPFSLRRYLRRLGAKWDGQQQRQQDSHGGAF